MILLNVALVFSTLAPLIAIFSLIEIVVARVVYGYFWATERKVP